LKQRNSINDSLNQLDTQLSKLENNLEVKKENIVESIEKEKISNEKVSLIPNMMKCYICEGK
jgi:hypothetical protein